MKNILLLAHEDNGQQARLQAALDLVRAFDGHLTCLDVIDVPVIDGGAWSGLGHDTLVAEARRIETNNRHKMQERLRHEAVRWEWRELSGRIADCLAQIAALADLVVTSAHVSGLFGPDEHEIASDLLVRSRTPVLTVPDDLCRLDISGPAIVAWNGSNQAAAALRASVPLLKLASHVVLVEIDDDSIGIPAEQAAAYLTRYGLTPSVQRDTMMLPQVEKMLMEAVAEHQAGFVVMGAFGHWRTTEAIFGGVSRGMLLHSPVPLFMAH